MTSRKSLGLLLLGGVICLLAVIALLFFGSKMPLFARANGDAGSENGSTAKDVTRKYVFLTYSGDKLGEYNFFEDCNAKAEQAVADGRANSVLEYVYDQNFDRDALTKAEEAVSNNEASSVLEYMRKHEDSGKMAFLLYYDPMYAAAWGCYLDQKGVTGKDKILYAEQDLPVPQQPDAAILRFCKNTEEWDAAIARVSSYLFAKDNAYELKFLNNYTSSMYAKKDGITEGTPAVIVRNTTNAGGHFILITYTMEDGSKVELKLRLECGYQPIDIPNWTPSKDTPVPDNSTPVEPPEKEKKDKKDDPSNNSEAPNYDFWSPDMKNHDPDTTVTKKPVSPDSYVAPEPPTEATTESTTEDTGSVVPPETDSGSKIVDDTDGKTEKHDDKEYEVDAGNGKDNGDLTDIADPSNPEKPKVEEPLKDDKPMSEFTDFE
jgi:hypothetical protein